MRVSRIIGVVLMIIGVVLIIVGVTTSRSLVDSVSTLFTGHFTRNTMWYLIGGIASAVVGLLLTIGVVGRNRS